MNTASRLQSGAEPGQVLIGEPTWRLVRDAVAAEPAEPIEARGKAEPVKAWRVLSAPAGSPPRARRLDAPMVGRDLEAALLAESWGHVVDGRVCGLFTVLGVAGAGKSRLVEEFLASLGDGAEVLRGRCLSYGEGITWLPLAEAIRPALGLAAFSGAGDVEAAVGAAAAPEGSDAAAVAVGLGGLFGLTGSGSAGQMAWAVRRLLEARARRRPVVLVLDDVHWAEPALLDLVEEVAERAEAPILLLCMARPELLDTRPGWGSSVDGGIARLAPLGVADSDALATALLGGALPAEARERVSTAAGGNPLFLEEVLRMLVDEGRLVRDGDAWATVGDLSTFRIPPTVSALLSSRLDRLPDPERSALEAASVEGQSFSAGALEALLSESASDALPGHLRSLTRKELVVPERRSGPGRDGYRFRHILIRDAAYDAIPKASRARLHLAFANWLEAAAGDAVTEHLEVLGHHLAQAHRYRGELGLPDDPALRMRAATALGEAGHRAYDELGDGRTAIALLEAAIRLAPGTPEAARWDWLLTNVSFVVHHKLRDREWDVTREVYGDDVADSMVARDARTLREFADPASIDIEASRRQDLAALELYRAHGARHLEPGVLLRLAENDLFAGDPETAEARAREALALAEGLRSRHHVQWAAGDLLVVLTAGPVPLGSVEQEATAIVDRWAGRLASGYVLAARAEVRALSGNAAGAQRDLEEAARLAARVELAWDAMMLMSEAVVAYATGDPQRAVRVCREALSQIHADDALNRNIVSRSYARVLLDLGLDDEAHKAIRALEGTAVLDERAAHRCVRARLQARAGLLEEAFASIDEAEALVAPTGLAIAKADVALDRAHVLLAAARPDEARACAEEALRRYRAKGHEAGARRAALLV